MHPIDVNDATKVEVETASNEQPTSQPSTLNKFLDVVYFTPSWCQWDVTNPPKFTIWHNILYASAGGFSAANLYYSAPILNILAEDFNTSLAGVSRIPALAQAGSAAGLLLLLPLADVLPKRRFTLTLVTSALIMWIPLCITQNATVFLVFTFLTALFNGAPQIMLPLVSELADPKKRALSLAVVGSGSTLGILIARILSGIVTQFTSWRNVYWTGLGLQIYVLVALWLFMPDYPATTPSTFKKIVKGYPKLIWSIVTLFPKHPILVQSALISFFTFAALNAYWTTLTFVLTSPTYNYGSIVVGLFGLVAILPVVAGPLYGKYIIQPLEQPLYSVVVGVAISLVGVIVGTYSGLYNIAGLLIQGFLQDAGLTVVQISNRMSIHPVEPTARNRVNTAFVCVLLLGGLMGTSVGSIIYDEHGGWVPSGSFGVGCLVFCYVIVALRGPHEEGWIGWTGGWGRRSNAEPKTGDIESSPVDVADSKGSVEQSEKVTGNAELEKENLGQADETLHQ